MIENLKNKTYSFLRSSERWTHADMIYLAKGGVWLGVGQAITMISAFLSSVAFANLLPVETYGIYKYIFSLIAIISIPTLSGVSTAIIQAVSSGSEATLFTATRTKMRWGILSALLSIALAVYYYIGGNISLSVCFFVAAIFLPLTDPLNAYTSYLNGKKNFKLITKFNIINQFVVLAVMAVTIWRTNNIWLIILLYYLVNTTANAFFYYLTLRLDPPNKKIDKEAISYGKHLTVMNIIAIIAGQVDKIFIWHYLGAAKLAVYALSMAPIDQINSGLLKNTIALAMPKLSANEGEALKKTFPPKVLKFTALTMLAALIYIILAPIIYKLLFPKYLASIIYTRFYAITLAILPLSLFNTALTAQKQKKKLYFISYSASIIKIILLAILLPKYGVAGAIGAIIGSLLYNNSMQIYLFYKIGSPSASGAQT